MDRVIKIDNKDVGFRATALTPRLYRHKMGRDVVQDLNHLRRAYNKAMELPDDATPEAIEDAQLNSLDLEIFENVAWVMARQYDAEHVPDSPELWLDEFATFSIYEILPEILTLWQLNQETTSHTKNQ